MSKVKFGIRVPSFPIDGSTCKEFILQITRLLSSLENKYSSAWISDHLIPWAPFQNKNTDIIECLTAIGYFSAIFRKMDFGSIVLCNSYRNPALLAKMAATLDALTGKRFILGIGAGWMEEEYIEYGYEFPSTAVRINQMKEGVQIIKKMWTEDATTFEGKHFVVKGAHCNPKPDPPPPIMIGGGGEKLTLRVVAEYADWWNIPNVDPATYKHKLDILKHHCVKVGRDQDEISKTLGSMVAIARTREEAYEMAMESPFISQENIDAYFVGTPETINDKLKAFMELGVEYFILRFVDFPVIDGAELFADEVVPDLF